MVTTPIPTLKDLLAANKKVEGEFFVIDSKFLDAFKKDYSQTGGFDWDKWFRDVFYLYVNKVYSPVPLAPLKTTVEVIVANHKKEKIVNKKRANTYKKIALATTDTYLAYAYQTVAIGSTISMKSVGSVSAGNSTTATKPIPMTGLTAKEVQKQNENRTSCVACNTALVDKLLLFSTVRFCEKCKL